MSYAAADRSPAHAAYAVSTQFAWARTAHRWAFDQTNEPIQADNYYPTVEQVVSERFALIPQRQIDWLLFQHYAAEWKKSHPKASSSAMQVAFDPNYLRIVSMGERAIPCILRQLQIELETSEPDHWFLALWAATDGQNPIPLESHGKMREMATSWIEWGRQRGIIDDQGVGADDAALRNVQTRTGTSKSADAV